MFPSRAAITGTAFSDAILAYKPIAYWRLNEDAGTVAADHFGRFDLTWSAAPARIAPMVDNQDDIGNSIAGNGFLHADVADDPLLRPSQFTIMQVYRRATDSANRALCTKTAAGGGLNAGWSLTTVPPAGSIRIHISDTVSVFNVDGVISAEDGNAHLITATFDGSTLRLFIDGTPDGSLGSVILTCAGVSALSK